MKSYIQLGIIRHTITTVDCILKRDCTNIESLIWLVIIENSIKTYLDDNIGYNFYKLTLMSNSASTIWPIVGKLIQWEFN